jgi:hypothetical protein
MKYSLLSVDIDLNIFILKKLAIIPTDMFIKNKFRYENKITIICLSIEPVRLSLL